MYRKKIPSNVECGLMLFKKVLDGKWKFRLLCHIYGGVKRPGQLQRELFEADRRVLENQLKELIEHGLITKIIHSVKPPKVEYELTDLGKTLAPLLRNINEWAEAHRTELQRNITQYEAKNRAE